MGTRQNCRAEITSRMGGPRQNARLLRGQGSRGPPYEPHVQEKLPPAAGSSCPRRAPSRMRALGSYSRRAVACTTAARQPGEDGRDAEQGLLECRDKGTLHHTCYALEQGSFPQDPLRAPSRAHAPLSPTLNAQICISKAICLMHTRASVRTSLRTALQHSPEQTAPQQSGFTSAPSHWDCSRTRPNLQHPGPSPGPLQ